MTFDSPWGPPEPVVNALIAKYGTDHDVWFSYEEEQGWGGEFEWSAAEQQVATDETWDIPDSHAENMERKGYCFLCETPGEYDDDEKYFDCPKEDSK